MADNKPEQRRSFMNKPPATAVIPYLPTNPDDFYCPKCGTFDIYEAPGDGFTCNQCSHQWDRDTTIGLYSPKEFTSVHITEDVEIGFRMSDVTDWKCYTHEGTRTLFLSLNGRKEPLKFQDVAAVKIHALIKNISAEVTL